MVEFLKQIIVGLLIVCVLSIDISVMPAILQFIILFFVIIISFVFCGLYISHKNREENKDNKEE